MAVEKQRRVATVAELRARTLAAEARAALLAQQLRAAVDVVATLELQSATPQPNLRGDARRLALSQDAVAAKALGHLVVVDEARRVGGHHAAAHPLT